MSGENTGCPNWELWSKDRQHEYMSKESSLAAPAGSADTELMKARNIGDALAAALMGEYSRADALGQWAADLKLPDNQELVEKLKADGVPVEKWERIHAKVYPPNTELSGEVRSNDS